MGETGVCNKIMIPKHTSCSGIQLVQLIGHPTAQISTLFKMCGRIMKNNVEKWIPKHISELTEFLLSNPSINNKSFNYVYENQM